MQGNVLERRDVHYQGRVQGVGFRYTVCNIARRHPVVGFVQNLANGQVRLVAEGNSACLDDFLAEIDDAMAGNITTRLVDKPPAKGEFNGFDVRR